MNITKIDHYMQAFLVLFLSLFCGILLTVYGSWMILLSIVLLKVYQIIGGGGIHLWACHNLYADKIGKKLSALIAICWALCGIGRASYFCKYHIIHHFYCDKEGDPHSPNDHSMLTLTLGLWGMTAANKDKYITAQIQDKLDQSYNRINSYPIMKWIDKWHYSIISSILLVTFIISPTLCLYAVALPMLLNILDGNYFFVYYFHKGGKVRNIPWVNYWILNSGNHRTHHKWLK